MDIFLKAFSRSFEQVADRAFLKVFLLGMATTIGALIFSFIVGQQALENYAMGRWEWLDAVVVWASSLLFIWVSVFFFPAISTIFVSIFLDDIVDAVEDRYYADRLAGQRLGLTKIGWLALRLGLIVLALNIAVLPLYVLLIWVPFAPFIIFWGLNSYLLGWGYYEMVAVRHLGIREAGRHRSSIRGQVLTGGLFTTFLFTIPLVNLTAPILGAAYLTHVFHLSLKKREAEMRAAGVPLPAPPNSTALAQAGGHHGPDRDAPDDDTGEDPRIPPRIEG